MKALLYTKPFHFEYGDFPDPEIPPDHVLVRVQACGICGSDVHGYTGSTGRRIPPLIMGHEAAGIIEDFGKDVKGFRKGDRVCFDSTVYCNHCEACQQGHYNHCIHREVLGVSIPGSKRNGAFAEFVAVPWWIVLKLPDHLALTNAALLEPLSIAVHAANRAPLSAKSTVLIIGAGTIGLLLVQAVKLEAVSEVIVSDINEFRLETAQAFGAEKTVNPQKIDLKEFVLEETDQRGAHVVFEAVGLAETFQQALAATRTGGHVTLIGNLEKIVEINVQELISKELTLQGSYANGGEYRSCVDLAASGKIQVGPLISEILPLAEGQHAFDRLHRAEENLLKIILTP